MKRLALAIVLAVGFVIGFGVPGSANREFRTGNLERRTWNLAFFESGF